jgi:TRAP-type mannitol/chloroaromatic compound transport system substrate-binding protein
VESAAMAANQDMLAKYDAKNPAALRSLVGAGAQLRPFSAEILDAAYKATNEVYAEISAQNADFKKLIDSLRAFRNEEYLWFQVAEYAFDTYMIRARTRG